MAACESFLFGKNGSLIFKQLVLILSFMQTYQYLFSYHPLNLESLKKTFMGFIKSTDHRLIDHRPTKHRLLTHRPTDPPTHRPNNAVIMFKRYENSMIFTLQNINTDGKT